MLLLLLLLRLLLPSLPSGGDRVGINDGGGNNKRPLPVARPGQVRSDQNGPRCGESDKAGWLCVPRYDPEQGNALRVASCGLQGNLSVSLT